MEPTAGNSSTTDRLLRRVAAGEREVWGDLLTRHRDRLCRMIAVRLDQRLQGRIDPSDVVQEAYLTASVQLADYLRDPALPFFLWLRLLTGQKLLVLHRHHLSTEARDAGREVSLDRGALPEASSAVLAAQLMGNEPRPSEAAVRAELRGRLREALDCLEPLDREVLALRHFEQLTTAEVAQVLGLKPKTTSKRYLRALKRLKEVLTQARGGPEELIL
jgi:RNA polymerase sigma-70 factor (ECF subfamily)